MSESLSYRLALDNADYVRGMRSAQAEVRQLSAASRSSNLGTLSGELQLASGSASSFTSSTGSATTVLGRFSAEGFTAIRSIGGIGVAFAAVTAPITGYITLMKSAMALTDAAAPLDAIRKGLEAVAAPGENANAKLEELRQTGLKPGLDFEQAARGQIRLQAVGMESGRATSLIKETGNALALVGASGDSLDGVLTAFTQIAAKGVVSAEEINQIAERLPQIRTVMKEAFGTADTTAIQEMGMSMEEFFAGIERGFATLPRAAAPVNQQAKEIRANLSAVGDEVKDVGAKIGNWTLGILDASRVTASLRRDFKSLKEAMFGGPDSEAVSPADPRIQARLKQITEERAAKETADAAAAQAEVDAHNRSVDAATKASQDKIDAEAYFQKQREAEQEAAFSRMAKAEEEYFRKTLSREQQIAREMAQLKQEGPVGSEAAAKIGDQGIKAEIYERTLKLKALEKELADLQATAADKAANEAEAAERKAQAEERALRAREQAKASFEAENAILAARAAGNERLAKQLERAAAVEQIKLQLMREQGLGEAAASAAAERRMKLQEAAGGRDEGGGRIRLLSKEESEMNREARKSAADKAREARWAGIGEANAAARDAQEVKTVPKDKDHTESIAKKLDTLDKISTQLEALGIAQ